MLSNKETDSQESIVVNHPEEINLPQIRLGHCANLFIYLFYDHHNDDDHHQSVLPKGRSFTASTGT